ncbi:hypothetical protein CO667_19675 [Rhizobium sp. L43]|nr:hypothetical protein CO667_19675 [Rhizobium sp. L43]
MIFELHEPLSPVDAGLWEGLPGLRPLSGVGRNGMDAARIQRKVRVKMTYRINRKDLVLNAIN